MFRQATVEDISSKRITKRHGRIVVITQYYPRFLKKPLIDEYVRALAPTRELLDEFKKRERGTGDHDGAFDGIHYESKFTLGEEGLAELARLSEEARARDVYLVCHCKVGQRCHRELIMLTAHALHRAPISRVAFAYPVFKERLAQGLFR